MTSQQYFLAACEALKINPEELPIVKGVPELFQQPIIAHYKLMVIAKHWNGDWEADYKNTSQKKYFPYFYMSASGFSYSGYYYVNTTTLVGARLSYKTKDLAIKAGEELTDLYQAMFGIL